MKVSGGKATGIGLFVGLVGCFWVACGARAELIHRWSFNEVGGSGTVLTDSVGTADATIVESGANNADAGTTVPGQVYLAGGAKASSDYVLLPIGTFSAIAGDATIELWATTYSVQNWSRVFSFGAVGGAERISMSWTRGTTYGQDEIYWRDDGNAALTDNNNVVNDTMSYVTNQQHHIVMTIDVEAAGPGSKTVVNWYKDGVWRGSLDTYDRLPDLNDNENALGRSKYNDNTANASYNELRIYDNTLDPLTIALHAAAGPDVLAPESGAATAITMASATANGELPATNGVTDVKLYWGTDDQRTRVRRENALNYGRFNWAPVDTLTAIDDGVANGRNGGLLTIRPSVSAVWTGAVGQTSIGDYYCQMWWGELTPPTGGDYTFVVHGDDNEVLWIDLNRNGEFEAGEGELVTANMPPEGWNAPKTNTVALTGGESYAIAMAHYEGGGGDFFSVTITPPGGSVGPIDPSLPEQSGWWTATGWEAVEDVGAQPAGTLAVPLNGLTADTTYHYCYYASNAVWQLWAGDVTAFRTLGSFDWGGNVNDQWNTAGNWGGGNVPDAAGEYARFTGAGAGNVDLNGANVGIDQVTFEAGDYALVSSGGAASLTLGALTNAAGDNVVAVGATLTGDADVSGGSLTLTAPDAFSAGTLRLSGGDVAVKTDETVTTGRLLMRGYHVIDDNLHNLSGNAGLMALTPYGEAYLTTGPGDRGLDFNSDADFIGTGAVGQGDNFMTLFLGYFNAQETGTHTFRVENDDDRSSVWLDLNENGVFEAPIRASGNGECLAYEDGGTKSVSLKAGHSYRFAVVHGEYGGASTIDVNFKTPSMGAETTIKPADAAQIALWSTVAHTADVELIGTPLHVTAAGRLDVSAATNVALGTMTVDAGGTLTLATHTDRPGGLDVAIASVDVAGGLTVESGQVTANGWSSTGATAVAVLRGAALTVDAPLTADTILAYGGLTVPGAITAATKMSFDPLRTITNVLEGTADVWFGESRAANAAISLTVTNLYTGDTVLRRAQLHADDGVGLPNTNSVPGCGALRFNSVGDDEYAVYENHGVFARGLGTGGGQVYWDDRGGFAALGGDLTVTLNGGAPLTWDGTTNGFNGKRLQFGSADADGAVTLVNDIDLAAGDRYLFTFDNTATAADMTILSGTITGSNGGTWFRKYRTGLLWLTATNTYAQRTFLDEGVLRADDGVGWPTNSTLVFDQNTAGAPGVLEAKGTVTRNIGPVTEAGAVSWDNQNGGFAAYGGPLTVTLEGGIQLNWGDVNTGFDGHSLQLGSYTANNVVELTNPINLNDTVERNIYVFDNTGTLNDLSVISGKISGTNTAEELWIRGNGVLQLTAANDYTKRTAIDDGATLRADDGVGLPTASTLVFDANNTAVQAILETRGTFTRGVGPATEAGAVSWDWQAGGFAAYGGPLDVRLEGGNALYSAGSPDTGFDDHVLQLGSKTATDVVDFQNDILLENSGNGNGDYLEVRVFDNPFTTNDVSIMSGTISFNNPADMGVRGDGVLRLTADNMIRQLRVYDSATCIIEGYHYGNDYVFTEANQNGTLGGDGTVFAWNYIDIRAGGTLSPGKLNKVGTLKAEVLQEGTAYDLEMQSGSTYAWQLGGAAGDKVEVTGNLRLTAGWTLKVTDGGGGMPVAAEEYDLFTYTGNMNDYSAPVLDFSDAPAYWVTDGAQVVHDDVNKRVYLTGVYSTLNVGNREATDLTSASATLNGVVSCSNETVSVWAYWGGANGGMTPGAWEHEVYVGVLDHVVDMSVDSALSSLSANTMYYYAFRITNATTDLWATPSATLTTLGPPHVDNAGATDVAAGSATLRGVFLDHNRGDVTLCWGTVDGGTAGVGDWQYSMSIGTQNAADFAGTAAPVYFPRTYVYRCYATNAYGSDWSDTTATFTVTTKPDTTYPLNGLMGRWAFDDGTCDDSSGNGYDGEKLGGAYSTDVPAALAGGKSIDLRGGDYIVKVDTGGDQDVFNLDTLTVSCWTKGWPDGNWEPFVCKRGETGMGWQLRRSGTSTTNISWTLRGLANEDWNAVSTNVSDGAWHHLVGTYGDGYRRIYVDGVKIGEVVQLGLVADTTDMLTFGGRQTDGTFGYYSRVQLDDILIYNRALTESEVAGLSVNEPVSAVTIANALPTDVTDVSATLNANLSLPDSVYDVWVYWGTSDGGTNTMGVWDDLAMVGTFTDFVGRVSYPVTGLTSGVTNWYAFRLIAAGDTVWATPSMSFMAATTPAVNNGAGALTAVGGATLRGDLTAGNFADVTVYWGRSDGGTDPGSWDSAIVLADMPQGAFATNVAAGYGETYYYRCHAENASGSAWAPATASFMTDVPADKEIFYTDGLRGSIFSGLTDDETALNLDGGAFSNSLTRVFVGDKANTILTLNEETAYNCIVTGEVSNWDDFPGFPGLDHFVTAVSGRMFPRETGLHGIRWDCDDRGLMFVDLNGNGVFETAERVAPYAWASSGLMALTNGVGGYDFVFMAQDITGNQTLNWYVTEPNAGEVRVDTEVQAGMWRYATSEEARPALANAAVSGLTTDGGTLNADLRADGWVFDVYACWGTSDGGQSTGAWEHVDFVGAFTNFDGVVSCDLSGLTQGQAYHYSFTAMNAVTNLWGGDALRMTPLGPPAITNLPATDVTIHAAVLNGDLTQGGQADVTIYWGLADGGNDAGQWDNAASLGSMLVGPLEAVVSVWGGGKYYYRCYASNAYGEAWASTSETFTTPVPRQFYHAGLLGCHTNGNMYLGSANAGNLGFVLGPYGGRAAAEHWRDVIVPDNSTLMYTGQIHLPGGPVTFVESIDDRTRLVIDGQVVMDNGAWNDTTHATISRDAGWYEFDLRFSNGGGGYGPVLQDGWRKPIGFGIDLAGRDTEQEYDFVFPEDPGDQTLFRSYDTNWPGTVIGVELANTDVSDLGSGTAVMHGTLNAPEWALRVYAMWGTSDGGTNFTAWENAADLGSYTNFSGELTAALDGLLPNTDYRCAFFATNAVTNVWAAPAMSFQGLGAPTIDNLAATNVTDASATLRGTLLSGGAADVTIYWGLGDGGTTPAMWANTSRLSTVMAGPFASAESILAGGTYYYRCYATNAAGADWADASESFTAWAPELSIADTSVMEGQSGTGDMAFDVTLSAPCVATVTVAFATADASATAGADYVATNGVLTIPPGAAGGTVHVTVIGDRVPECPSECLVVNLAAPANATVTDTAGSGTIVDDDLDAALPRWSCKMPIVFSGYTGSETLTNFPALVVLRKSMDNFAYSQFASPHGWDLRFTDASQTKCLNYEIEHWDPSGDSFVWVQLPELKGQDTTIWAFWGNDELATAPVLSPNTVPGCSLWLDAGDLDGDGVAEGTGESTLSGSRVDVWVDKSGAARSATRVAGTPTQVSGAVNGRPVVRFDGGATYMDGPTDDLVMQTVFIVAKVDATIVVPGGVFARKGADNTNIRVADATSWRAPGHVADGNDFCNGGSVYVNGAAGYTHDNQYHILQEVSAAAVSLQYRISQDFMSRFFKGDVAEILIYRRVLTTSERNQVGAYLAAKYGLETDYTAPAGPVVDAPAYALDGSTWDATFVGVWHLAGTGDDSARGRDGTLYGTPAFSTTTAVVGPAMNFDGAVNYVDVDDGFGSFSNGLSISAWTRTEAFGSWARVIDFSNGQDTDNVLFARNGTTDTVAFDFKDTESGNDDWRPAGSYYLMNEWQYMVGTCRPGSAYAAAASLYLNAQPFAELADRTLPVARAKRTSNYIGRSNSADALFEGQMDEVRVSKVPRSADWIAAAYGNVVDNAGFNAYGTVEAPTGTLLLIR